MRKLQDDPGLDQLLESGKSGFFPLFYQDWIVESFNNSINITSMPFSRAVETVHRVYKQIEGHPTLEKKKFAIQALAEPERKDFVLSFMKMVEYRSLDTLRDLH